MRGRRESSGGREAQQESRAKAQRAAHSPARLTRSRRFWLFTEAGISAPTSSMAAQPPSGTPVLREETKSAPEGGTEEASSGREGHGALGSLHGASRWPRERQGAAAPTSPSSPAVAPGPLGLKVIVRPGCHERLATSSWQTEHWRWRVRALIGEGCLAGGGSWMAQQQSCARRTAALAVLRRLLMLWPRQRELWMPGPLACDLEGAPSLPLLKGTALQCTRLGALSATPENSHLKGLPQTLADTICTKASAEPCGVEVACERGRGTLWGRRPGFRPWRFTPPPRCFSPHRPPPSSGC